MTLASGTMYTLYYLGRRQGRGNFGCVKMAIIKNFEQDIIEFLAFFYTYADDDDALQTGAEDNKCPLEGNCLIKNIAYMAAVETETNTSSYIGMTGNSLKTRYYNHIKSFKNKRYKNETELSKYIWKSKKRKSSTPSRGKSCVNLTPANDGTGCVPR